MWNEEDKSGVGDESNIYKEEDQEMKSNMLWKRRRKIYLDEIQKFGVKEEKIWWIYGVDSTCKINMQPFSS
jgi:hypothetical protein